MLARLVFKLLLANLFLLDNLFFWISYRTKNKNKIEAEIMNWSLRSDYKMNEKLFCKIW